MDDDEICKLALDSLALADRICKILNEEDIIQSVALMTASQVAARIIHNMSNQDKAKEILMGGIDAALQDLARMESMEAKTNVTIQ